MAPGNQAAWWFFQKMAPLLRDGLGGISGPGIEAALRLQGVPELAKPELLHKLLILLTPANAPEGGDDGK